MLAHDPEYKRWLLEYVDVWAERTRVNKGMIPSKIGLDGRIGGPEGKWYWGVYGWGFSVVVPQTGELGQRVPSYRRRNGSDAGQRQQCRTPHGNPTGRSLRRAPVYHRLCSRGNPPQDARCYVTRKADTDLYEAVHHGEFCYVLTSRQMGKSSVIVRTTRILRDRGVCAAVLDLTAIGQNLTAEQWYDGLLTAEEAGPLAAHLPGGQ